MTKIQTPILLIAAIFLTSCGNHNFLEDLFEIFTLSSSSDYGLSSSSENDIPIYSDVEASSASNETGDSYGLALTAFTTSKTKVSQNEAFTVNSGFGNDFMYTRFPGGLVGTALVDGNDNIKAVTGIRTLGALDPRTPTMISSYGAKDEVCVVPNVVASGRYRLRMVALKEGDEEWQIVVHSRGNIPTFIDFENNANTNIPDRKSVN